MRSLAIEVYKVINKECPVYLQDLIRKKNNSYSFRYQNIAELPQARTTSHGLQSFRYVGTISFGMSCQVNFVNSVL